MLTFPQNPQINDQYTGENGVTYTFDGVKWTGLSNNSIFGQDGTLTLPNSTKLGPVQYPSGIELFTDNPNGYTQLNWGNTQFVWTDNEGVHLQTADVLRAAAYQYRVDTDGVMTGPAMGALSIGGGIIGQNGLYLGTLGTARFSQTVQFLDADGTSKSVYTIDYGVYNIGGMNDGNPLVTTKTLWIANGQSMNIVSAVASNSPTTITITLGNPVVLQAATNYTIDWYVTQQQTVTITTNNKYWYFNTDGTVTLPPDGGLRLKDVLTKVSTPYISALTPEVVWTSSNPYQSGIKLFITAEGWVDGDNTGWHTQSCEAIIAARGSYSQGEPVMSVYGVVYTSPTPLTSFSVRRNSGTGLIEVLSTQTAANSGQGLYFRIEAKESNTRD